MKNPFDFGDSLSFPLDLPAGPSFHLPCEMHTLKKKPEQKEWKNITNTDACTQYCTQLYCGTIEQLTFSHGL